MSRELPPARECVRNNRKSRVPRIFHGKEGRQSKKSRGVNVSRERVSTHHIGMQPRLLGNREPRKMSFERISRAAEIRIRAMVVRFAVDKEDGAMVKLQYPETEV